MAFEENLTFTRRSFTAAADLSAKQFFAIYNGNVAGAGKAIDGILQDNPANGKTGCIAYNGLTKAVISASQALTAGVTLLEVDTGGTLTTKSSGIAVAKAAEALSSVASTRIVTVQLLPANDAFV